MSVFCGEKLKIEIFGSSHDKEIGARLYGFPEDFPIDEDKLAAFMARRAPKADGFSTMRHETDTVSVEKGDFLTFTLKNTDARPEDYEKTRFVPRPGHADYTSFVKYGKIFPGGGAFSGRMTAPLCAVGAVCLDFLEKRGIYIGAHIESMAGILDRRFDEVGVSDEDFSILHKKDFPVIDTSAGERMTEKAREAKNSGDSVGGIIECAAVGVPAGLGGELFGGLESKISALVFAVPAVKGIEFGAGFACADITGHENNDEFYFDSGTVRTFTNNCGGILGGISDGMPLIFRAAIKPTPTISKKQRSVDLDAGENTVIECGGRHDAAIVPRAVPAIESVMAIALADALTAADTVS